MKTSTFKKMIKEAMKEAIQEELKEILLEAVKSPKQPIQESYTPSLDSKPPSKDVRKSYMDVLGETALNLTSNDVPRFSPGPDTDPVNGNLPEGELGMDQIMTLMNGK